MNESIRHVEDAVQAFNSPDDHKEIYTMIYRWLLDSDIMEQVATRLKSGKQRPYLRRYDGELCLYPSAEGIHLERNGRDKLLQTLLNRGIIQIDKDLIFSKKDDGCRLFLKGWGIYLTYKEFTFYWSKKNMLYINDSEYKKIDDNISEDDFIKLLDSAIDAKENHDNIIQ
jgi:hypothetical protein